MECSTGTVRVRAKHLASAFLQSLAIVSLFIVAFGALYVPFDRYRASQRRHVTVLDCNLPLSNDTLVSLVRIHNEQMKAAADSQVTLVNLHDCQSVQEVPLSGAAPVCITATHDKRRLFVGTVDGEIFSLDCQLRGAPQLLIGENAGTRAEELAVSPNDHLLVSRGYRSFHAWDLERKTLAWQRVDLDATTFTINSDATLVCGTNTGEILELSLVIGKTLRLLARHKTTIRHVAAAGQTLAAVDSSGEAILFRRRNGAWVRQPADKLFSGNSRLALSADGKRAVGTSRCNRLLICWNLDEQEPLCHMAGHKGIIINAGFLADGSIFSCGNDGTVRVWDLAAHGALRLVTRISPLFAG
jgi:WD40 repeat protein